MYSSAYPQRLAPSGISFPKPSHKTTTPITPTRKRNIRLINVPLALNPPRSASHSAPEEKPKRAPVLTNIPEILNGSMVSSFGKAACALSTQKTGNCQSRRRNLTNTPRNNNANEKANLTVTAHPDYVFRASLQLAPRDGGKSTPGEILQSNLISHPAGSGPRGRCAKSR